LASRKSTRGAENNKGGKAQNGRFSERSKTLLLIIVVLFIVFYVRGPFRAFVQQFFVKTTQVEVSVLEDKQDAEFLLIRNEKAVSSELRGTFEKSSAEGERVNKDAVVGYLTVTTGTSLEKTERLPVTAPYTGIVSYHTDGYESICNPETWPALDLNKLVELQKGLSSGKSGENKKEGAIAPGQALFKIMDNLAEAYIFTEIPLPEGHELTVGGSVALDLAEGAPGRIRGTVTQLEQKNELTRLLIEMPPMPQLNEYRKVKGSIVVKSIEGAIVDKWVLAEKEGRKGIYLLENGIVVWQEVVIISQVGDKAVVEGLEKDDWIITMPAYVTEGQKLRFHR
jgi:putative membrane fusion protein